MTKKYRVAWEDCSRNESGHSEWNSNKDIVQDVADEMNNLYPSINH